MEKGNQPAGGDAQASQPDGADGAAGAAGGATSGTTIDPGTGTGTEPAPVGGSGGGQQADQSGPKREWERIGDREWQPGGGYSMTETDGEGALRNTTWDAKGNLVSEEISENPNVGPGPEPSDTGTGTSAGIPPESKPFGDDVPSAPGEEQPGGGGGDSSARPARPVLPEQEAEFPDGSKLRNDGQGGVEYQEDDLTIRLEGDRWVDSSTGKPVTTGIADRAAEKLAGQDQQIRLNPPQ